MKLDMFVVVHKGKVHKGRTFIDEYDADKYAHDRAKAAAKKVMKSKIDGLSIIDLVALDSMYRVLDNYVVDMGGGFIAQPSISTVDHYRDVGIPMFEKSTGLNKGHVDDWRDALERSIAEFEVKKATLTV